MKVYVVLDGDYSTAWVEGVYASFEAATSAHPGEWRQETPQQAELETWTRYSSTGNVRGVWMTVHNVTE